MGQMVNGSWVEDDLVTSDQAGNFVRPATVFRCGVMDDDKESPFQAEAGRYHLFISFACPWACRTLAVHGLKGLEPVLSFSSVDPLMTSDGWQFSQAWPDPLGQRALLQDIYKETRRDYTGRVTVPVLWDKQTNRIVCNESSDIMRLLNRDFLPWAKNSIDLYPSHHQKKIDVLNEMIYNAVNNGVYRCGFAKTQSAYDEAVHKLFNGLDELESRLDNQRWLFGDQLTESDIRLFVTLIRFDVVYCSHFKCSRRRIIEYPNLWRHTRDLYRQDGIKQTVDIDHIKRHYFGSQLHLNPSGIIPSGPELDYTLP